MSEHYPRIRIRAESGGMLIREGLSFNFYCRRFHQELLPALLRSLEEYRRAVGPEGLGLYWDQEGDPQVLDATGWTLAMRDLTAGRITRLGDVSSSEHRYRFDYYGKEPDLPALASSPHWLSPVSFWMPTEYLEEHGPAQVRALALRLAAPLPFCSGHVGLSFNSSPDLLGVRREIRRRCFRYPGLDIPELGYLSWSMGTRLRGAAWLTFLGQPVLGIMLAQAVVCQHQFRPEENGHDWLAIRLQAGHRHAQQRHPVLTKGRLGEVELGARKLTQEVVPAAGKPHLAEPGEVLDRVAVTPRGHQVAAKSLGGLESHVGVARASGSAKLANAPPRPRESAARSVVTLGGSAPSTRPASSTMTGIFASSSKRNPRNAMDEASRYWMSSMKKHVGA